MASTPRSGRYGENHMETWILGTPMFIWEQKLIMVKQALKWWTKYSLISLAEEKKQIKGKLDELQKKSEDSEITFQLQKEELDLQCQYQNALKREEEYWS
jgi:hypothetical protein